ncbi:MAG: hypothetical protein LUI06_08045 [Ruminococcus sp.]|nr:hypothetical protein [Ruminococcus sp.]
MYNELFGELQFEYGWNGTTSLDWFGRNIDVDFVVGKNGKIVDSVEITSLTADKTAQMAKEMRIRQNGGNYVRLSDKSLVEIPSNIITRIVRLP